MPVSRVNGRGPGNDGLTSSPSASPLLLGQRLHLLGYYSQSHLAPAALTTFLRPGITTCAPRKSLYLESTFNDQRNPAVVNRVPVAEATYPHLMSADVHTGVLHPQSYASNYCDRLAVHL
ncbi:uncharacterized protein P174DRAFT_449620 [Aspergillus novofumigatus IBT 16806]|uniref:Uncharacterized protein n=1 Tax=Aspergillus novofumigatus (strain IBT 16806) TaxID=1392255 RepID=A0A2I1CBW7_ASPN1|nr:uncharacterized protein P174DRAFT_449620 [Aspergillus novofumigatus IBT 16806]PKX95129.1 hypothetical protein P174DRAFT_449620 [Aspergillus novofumigatus IBT 16806]